MIERPNHVRVTNTNKERVIGRYSGQDFEFLPGKPVDIPIQAAVHIFAFGKESKVDALNRLGWLRSSEELERAMAKLNCMRFTDAPPLIEAEMPEPMDVSASERLPQTGSPVSPESGGGGGTRGHAPAPPNPRAK